MMFVAPEPESVGVDASKLRFVFERARQEVATGRVQSCQVAVCRGGRCAGMATFGRCSADTTAGEVEATDRTLSPIFSCTKVIVAIAMWQLLDEGKIRLDDAVEKLIPGFGEHGKHEVTILHLLTFTCGFPNPPGDLSDTALMGSSAARTAAFATWPLATPPGESWAYHGTSAHWVMVEILERCDGEDFRTALERRVLHPILGEVNNRGCLLGASPPEQARHHIADVVVRQDADRYDKGMLSWNSRQRRALGVPGGGGLATAADLALLLQPLLHNGVIPHSGKQLLSPSILALATATQHTDARHIRQLTDEPALFLPVRRGLVVEIAGDDELAVPPSLTVSSRFMTDKVELANFAGQRIGAKVMRQAGFGFKNSGRAFGHDGVGGKFCWADPSNGLSMAFVTDTFTAGGACLLRSQELSDLACACLVQLPPPTAPQPSKPSGARL